MNSNGVVFCSEEGKVRKVLKVEPLPDGSGHFFNLGNALFLPGIKNIIYFVMHNIWIHCITVCIIPIYLCNTIFWSPIIHYWYILVKLRIGFYHPRKTVPLHVLIWQRVKKEISSGSTGKWLSVLTNCLSHMFPSVVWYRYHSLSYNVNGLKYYLLTKTCFSWWIKFSRWFSLWNIIF